MLHGLDANDGTWQQQYCHKRHFNIAEISIGHDVCNTYKIEPVKALIERCQAQT